MGTIMMQCPRDFVLRSTQGHTVIFKANKATPVPEALYADALARNIVPVKGPIDTDSAATGNSRVNLTGPLRDALIFYAFSELEKRNNHEDFDGGGNPKPEAIKALVGVPISTQERAKYWANYRELMGNNIEIPTHPNLHLVLELQSLSTRKDLKAFAEENGINVTESAGKTNADFKNALLASMVNFTQAPANVKDADTSTLEEN